MQFIQCYSYIRFSDPSQAKGTSERRQTDLATALIAKHQRDDRQLVLDTSLAICDRGRSGFHSVTARKGLMAFLAAIESGKVPPGSWLIIEKLDRLSRGDIEAATDLVKRIVKQGITISTCDPERFYTQADLKNAFVWIELIMIFSVANEESAKKSTRQTRNWEYKRADGIKGGKRPAWIKIASDGVPYIEEKDKAVIRRIFNWCIEGLGQRLICKKLNQDGVPNIAHGYTSTRTSTLWNQQYVKAILDNRATYGEHQHFKMVHDEEGNVSRVPLGKPIANYFPAAIDENTFRQAKAARGKRDKPKGRVGHNTVNLFAGLIFDRITGSSMRIVNSSQNDKAKGILRRIANYHATEGAAIYQSWPLEQFEALFFEAMEVNFGAFAPQTKKLTSILPALNDKLEEISANIEEVQKDIVAGGSYRSLRDLLIQLDSDRDAVEKQIEEEKTRIEADGSDPACVAISIIDRLANTPPDELEEAREKLKRVIARLIEHIEVMIWDINGNRLHKKIFCWIWTKHDQYSFVAETRGGTIVQSAGGWDVEYSTNNKPCEFFEKQKSA